MFPNCKVSIFSENPLLKKKGSQPFVMSQMGTEHLFFILFQNVKGKKKKSTYFLEEAINIELTVLWVSILSDC